MKRVICAVLLVVLAVMLFLACDDTNEKSKPPAIENTRAEYSSSEVSVPESENINTDSSISEEAVTDNMDVETVPLTEEMLTQLDDEFQRKYDEVYSTSDMVNICNTYQSKWEVIADRCYEAIMACEFEDDVRDYTPQELHETVEKMKQNWDDFYTEECELYNKAYTIVNGGTMIRITSAYHAYELQMEWATQLFYIYDELRWNQ